MTERIESKTIQMVATNGRPIRKVTRIIIDGQNVDFTERLTAKQIARYIESRKAQPRQAETHAEMMALGG